MKGKTRSILLFFVAFALILAVYISDYRQSQRVMSSFRSVEESQQRIVKLNKLASSLKDVQRSHRGYVLTQKPEFLVPYDQASDIVPGLLSDLSSSLSRERDESTLIDTLTAKTFKKLAYVESAIVQVNSGKIPEAVGGILYGKRLFDQMIAIINQLEAKERQRTTQLQEHVNDEDRINQLIIATGLIVSLILMTIAIISILRNQEKIERLKNVVEESNKQLSNSNEELKAINETLEESKQQLIRAQEALQYREKQLNQAQRISKTGSIDWNVKTDVISFSDEFAKLMRISPSEHYSFQKLLHKVHPDDQRLVSETIRAATTKRTAFQFEFRLLISNETVFVLVAAEPINLEGKFHGYLGTITDISQQVLAQEELRHSETRFKSVLEAAPDPMVVCNHEGVISMVNKQTVSLFHYSKEELIGKKIEVLLPFRYRNNMIELRGTNMQTHRLTEGGLHLTISGLTKKGKEIPIDINFSPIRTHDGMLIIAAIRDVTLQREAEEKILEANRQLARGNDALQKANQELSSFSYSISHDLRAPLRSINGYSAILAEDYSSLLDERALKALKTIQDNASRMDTLINDLLELARLGYTSVNKQEVDMRQVIQSVLTGKNQDQKANVIIQPMGGAWADPSLIRQVWENLVSNALKFSGKNEHPEIVIGYEPKVSEQIYFVRDNGVGFDPAYSDKLFKVFSRLHGKHEFEGTGAGLAISKKIIEAHGGRMWAESELSKGATFYFAIPMEK